RARGIARTYRAAVTAARHVTVVLLQGTMVAWIATRTILWPLSRAQGPEGHPCDAARRPALRTACRRAAVDRLRAFATRLTPGDGYDGVLRSTGGVAAGGRLCRCRRFWRSRADVSPVAGRQPRLRSVNFDTLQGAAA